MSWVIDPTDAGAITLPYAPTNVKYRSAADIKEISFPTAKSLVISLGRKVDVMTWQGFIAVPGQGATYLETTYITPIEAATYKECHIDQPSGSRYHGDWILNKFEYEEAGGFTASFKYTIEFIRGSTHVVVAP